MAKGKKSAAAKPATTAEPLAAEGSMAPAGDSASQPAAGHVFDEEDGRCTRCHTPRWACEEGAPCSPANGGEDGLIDAPQDGVSEGDDDGKADGGEAKEAPK